MYQPACELPERGFWFRPTLFTGVSQSHRIAREEIFGPVLSILTFRTPEEAVEKANNTPYGLSRRRLDREGVAHPEDGPAPARRRGVGEHVQPVRSRPRRSAATRRAASAAKAACTAWSRTCRSIGRLAMTRPRPGAAHGEAVHRRRLPTQRERSLLRGRARTTGGRSPTSRRPRARTCATRSSPRAARSGPGRA